MGVSNDSPTEYVQYLRGQSLQWGGASRSRAGGARAQQQGLGVWKARSFEVGRRAGSLGLRSPGGQAGRRSAEELEEAEAGSRACPRSWKEPLVSGRRQKVQVKWSGWKRRPRADTHRPVTGRPRGAHRDPRRAWKWFSAQRAALVLEKAASREGRETFLRKGNHERMGQGQPPDQKILFWN